MSAAALKIVWFVKHFATSYFLFCGFLEDAVDILKWPKKNFSPSNSKARKIIIASQRNSEISIRILL